MIVLKDLFNLLASGEFSNISLTRTGSGQLNEKEYPKVIGHINLGILDIYKRFKFLENELVLHVDPSVSKYYLRPEKVTNLHNITTKMYIERPDDTEGCLNIIEVTSMWDSEGDELTMNNRYTTPAIKQLSNDTLKITGVPEKTTMNVVYNAYPDKIVIGDDFSPEEHMLAIPETIIEPLLYYIAMRVYKPTGSNDSTANADKSAAYQQQYELSCQKIDLYGLELSDDDSAGKFENEGWT